MVMNFRRPRGWHMSIFWGAFNSGNIQSLWLLLKRAEYVPRCWSNTCIPIKLVFKSRWPDVRLVSNIHRGVPRLYCCRGLVSGSRRLDNQPYRSPKLLRRELRTGRVHRSGLCSDARGSYLSLRDYDRSIEINWKKTKIQASDIIDNIQLDVVSDGWFLCLLGFISECQWRNRHWYPEKDWASPFTLDV